MAVGFHCGLNLFVTKAFRNQQRREPHFHQQDVYKRQILRYKLHRHLNGADAVKDELYANLYIREMRIIAVKDATDARNYNEAEKLCLEQIKKENGRFYRNTPEDWNNILFDVYMQSGITDKQIEQAKKILLLGNEGFWEDVYKRQQWRSWIRFGDCKADC